MSMNKVFLMGRLGADPAVKILPSGTTIANLSVATNLSYTTKSGEKKEETEWHKVVVFGKTAENCAQYLKKGAGVFVEGKLQTKGWEDKDGVKKYTTEIIASTVNFLDNTPAKKENKQPRLAPVQNIAEPAFDGEELPF